LCNHGSDRWGSCGSPIKKLFNINGYPNAYKNGYEAVTEIRAIETSSIIAVTAGILIGKKKNVLIQEWTITCPHYNR
jgi:hypothetical protein